jgi:7-carboxy-7-deazaguanine synthase
MVKCLIAANPTETRQARQDGSPILNIAEHFSRTIQGENQVGVPCTFLRLKNCTLNCSWCDSLSVFKFGNPYSINELVEMWEKEGVIEDLKNNHHMVFTGGSPLLQQQALISLIEKVKELYNFIPFIEVENECTIMPDHKMLQYVALWNNSPKLANSEMPLRARYKPEILDKFAQHYTEHRNRVTAVSQYSKVVFWKFVVTCEEEWQEIVRDFILPGYVKKENIVLMPEGQTRDELLKHYEFVVNLACREGVRMTDRLHITIFGKKVGV